LSTPNPHLTTDHTAVSKIVMYIIAITFVLCDALVLLAKGIDAMPFGIWGLLGSFVFIAAAFLMAQYVKRQPH
jgi:Zn-dependent protease with chaperone function